MVQHIPAQRIIKIRRDYNTWVADETLADYALRFTPRSFRKCSEMRVANTAFGAASFLALEAAIMAYAALLLSGVGAWWMVQAQQSREVAQEESNRQTQLLMQEIESHQRTDEALQNARQMKPARNAPDAFGQATVAVRAADGWLVWQTPLARKLLNDFFPIRKTSPRPNSSPGSPTPIARGATAANRLRC